MAEEFTPHVEETPAYTPEQEAQLVQEGLLTTNQTVSQTAEPAEELILGKFKTHDDLASAYQTLEQKMSNPSPDLASAMQTAGAYYQEHGEMDEASYQALQDAGIGRDYVDAYVNGVQATQEQALAGFYANVGGEANYGQMTEWMSSSLPETEITAYNNVIENGSADEVGVLMSGMYARYNAANSVPGRQLQGAPGINAAGFRSRGEVMAAMSDPRYEKDTAFRKDVENKLALTPDTVF